MYISMQNNPEDMQNLHLFNECMHTYTGQFFLSD